MIDATGHFTGTMSGNASINTQGLYSGALVAAQGGRVLTGNLGNMSQGTIEAFVDFKTACTSLGSSFPIITAGPDPANGQITLQLGSLDFADLYGPPPQYYDKLSFGMLTPTGWQYITANINACRYLAGWPDEMPAWPYDVWRYHHVAATWGPRGMELWVDGVLHGNGSAPGWHFMCNPQQQVFGPDFYLKSDSDPTKWQLWSGYPGCATPSVNSWAPPGTYAGGLLPYNTFQIGGCVLNPPNNSVSECFNGQIDEVRISNVQRTFNTSVDPTSTPTMTPTPERIGLYGIDQYTSALYHFDSTNGFGVLNEVSGQYSYANHALAVVPGRYNSAVALDGFTVIPMESLGVPGNGTVEAWVNLNAAPDPLTIIASKSYYNSPGLNMYLGKSGRLSQNLIFAVWDPAVADWVVADSGINPATLVGSWHHVAGTWGASGLQVWVDGQLRRTVSFSGGVTLPVFAYLIGCDPSNNCLSGKIDEFRLSSIQRHFAPVATPTPSLTPTPVYSSGPATTAQATIQPASAGLSANDQVRLNGLLNPIQRGSSLPSGSLPVGQLALAPSAPTPAPTLLAAMPVLQTPIRGNDPPIASASLPVKINPPAVDQPLGLDSNAIALYRLNSQYGITLSDATGNYPALLFGDATIKSIGADRPALTLNGGLSYAQVNHFASPQTGTVEVWARFDSNPGQMTIVTARQNSLPRFLLGVRADEGMALGFGLYNSGWQWADSGLTLKMLGSGWHHIAGSYGARGIEIWIDGVLRGANPVGFGLHNIGDDTLLIGWSPGSGGMNGQISQIRISNSQRTY